MSAKLSAIRALAPDPRSNIVLSRRLNTRWSGYGMPFHRSNPTMLRVARARVANEDKDMTTIRSDIFRSRDHHPNKLGGEVEHTNSNKD